MWTTRRELALTHFQYSLTAPSAHSLPLRPSSVPPSQAPLTLASQASLLLPSHAPLRLPYRNQTEWKNEIYVKMDAPKCAHHQFGCLIFSSNPSKQYAFASIYWNWTVYILEVELW